MIDNPDQHPEELAWWLDKIRCTASLLEIGSKHGFTLYNMSEVMLKNSKIRAIDYCYHLDPRVVDALSAEHDFDFHFGNSHDSASIEWARANGPYDVIFIDGDHAYEGVKADWINYGSMGRLVGFHDISGATVPGVLQFWNEVSGVKDQLVVSTMGVGLIKRC